MNQVLDQEYFYYFHSLLLVIYLNRRYLDIYLMRNQISKLSRVLSRHPLWESAPIHHQSYKSIHIVTECSAESLNVI